MAYRYFASRTIYQIVAVMETLFSTVILVFSCMALGKFYEEDEAFESDNQILLYSSIAGVIVGVVQILAAGALLLSSRAAFDKDDLAISKVPKVWFFLSFVTFALLIFIVTGPLVEEKVKRGLKTSPLKESIAHVFTYVVANALFKIIFIWAMSTTIRFKKRRPTESTLALER